MSADKLPVKVVPNYCECSCHVKGTVVLHFMECCAYTYEKYLNKDGTIDIDLYQKIVQDNSSSAMPKRD